MSQEVTFQVAATYLLTTDNLVAERVNDYGDKIRMLNNDGKLLFEVTDVEDTDWKDKVIFVEVDEDDILSTWDVKMEDAP